MTPARLTPMIVARVANDALEAHVGIGRVELTLWHTFPHLTVDIDSLTIVSEAFDSLPVGQKAFVSAESDTPTEGLGVFMARSIWQRLFWLRSQSV